MQANDKVGRFFGTRYITEAPTRTSGNIFLLLYLGARSRHITDPAKICPVRDIICDHEIILNHALYILQAVTRFVFTKFRPNVKQSCDCADCLHINIKIYIYVVHMALQCADPEIFSPRPSMDPGHDPHLHQNCYFGAAVSPRPQR